ncbi:MAG: magnesium-translocating P-type ATPase [Polyangiaceae bacterium]|nr:magnesium-translocating P-type ATPase [Polyangiaceae bacterium]
MPPRADSGEIRAAPWAYSPDEVLRALGTRAEGLSEDESRARLTEYGPNVLAAERRLSAARLLLAQVQSPLILLLVFAAVVSMVAGEWTDASMALAVVFASSLLGFFREYSAGKAIEELKSRVVSRAKVVRAGEVTSVEAARLVPGDVIALQAGSLIPADCVLLEAKDFFVNQAVLTGESLPVERQPGASERSAPLALRTSCLYLGTNVRTGTARAVVVSTGKQTVYGSIADKLTLRPPETEFDRGLRQFGQLLMIAMLIMVLGVLVLNLWQHRPLFQSLLFAIALAVGLAPELLPAILAVNLARSAKSMATQGVLVRRLNAIENFGSMDVLCTDKTGTLTEGVVRLEGSYDPNGEAADAPLREAALNAHFETGLANPLDDAISLAAGPVDPRFVKLDEIPYDFARKRLSVVVRDGERCRLVTKGSLRTVLDVCTRLADGRPLDDALRAELASRVDHWGNQGFRVLGVATREIDAREVYAREDERGLTFLGFLTFFDPPKADVQEAVAELARLGVGLKIISGDSRAVTVHVARAVGIEVKRPLTGQELDELGDEALWARVVTTNVFSEVDPNQKERIILALKKRGHVVGYMGDGINDAPALHAADVSVSVEGAVDVAKEASDFVLLKQDLHVLRRGVLEGRTTFANTLKYVLTTESANLGNMFSMAICSAFLPFLPLLAGQILLNNLLSDLPAVAIASDSVDKELIERPRRWDMRFIRRFMIEFGLLSSVFDLATFGALLWVFKASEGEFRTAWFVESLLTELVIALVVRTRRPFYKSRPGKTLLWITGAVAAIDLALPWLPGASLLGFTPLPLPLLFSILGITAAYVVAAELLKSRFYREVAPRRLRARQA